MRKTFLVLLALLMVSTMAFAQVQVEFEISGEATATFGVNLDPVSGTTIANGAVAAQADLTDGVTTGFSVSSDADLDIVFVEESTQEFGEGDVYGWLEIDDFKFEVDDGNASGASGDVSATLFLGPAYVIIATGENDINIADVGADAGLMMGGSILGIDDILSENNDYPNSTVLVGYTVPDLLDVQLGLTSWGTWAANYYNNYNGILYSEFYVGDLTISFDAEATLRGHVGLFDDSESAGDFGDNAFIAFGAEYEMMLDDMMTLVPYVGVDLFNDTSADAMDFEVVAGANVLWGADDLDPFEFISGNEDTDEGAGIEIGYASNVATAGADPQTDLWVRLGFAESSGDDGLFPIIGGAALVEFKQTTPATGDAYVSYALGAEVDADLGVVSPFFGIMTADTNTDADGSNGLTMNVGTDINVISATTFTIEYKSGNLLEDGDGLYDTNQYTVAAANDSGVTSKAGTFTISTKIEY